MSADLNSHLAAVGTLAQHGVEPPKPWQELHDRYRSFLALDNEHANTDALAAAVVTGKPAGLAQLYGAALAEWWPKSVSDVRAVVGASVHAELERLYAPHAEPNYRQLRDEFDTAAKQFAGCVELIDPETSSDGIVGEHEKLRSAWMEAPRLAGRLDELMSALAAAAVLVGADEGLLLLAPETEPLRVALTVDDKGLHRRRVWECWAAEGRTGRWGPLAALGAKIRAHPHPDRLEGYREPRPTGVKFVREGPGGGHVGVPYDPEDTPDAVEASVADEWSVA